MRKKRIHSGARLFALFCMLTLSVGHAWAASYWKIRVVAVDADGGETNGLVIAGEQKNSNALLNSDDYATDYTMPTVGTQVLRNNPNYYLSAKEPDDASFMGWYKDAACTTQLSPSMNASMSSSSVATASTEADAPTTTIYALFTKHKKYWKVRVVAVDADGGETAGRVIAGENKNSTALQNSENYSTDYTMPVAGSQMYNFSSRSIFSPYSYMCAKEAEGTYFIGWFSDEACTENLASSALKNWPTAWNSAKPTEFSDNEDDVPVTTYYALFTTKKFYAVLHYIADVDNLGRGAFNKSYSTYQYVWNDSQFSQISRDDSYTFAGSMTLSPVVLRGWKFKQWKLIGDGMAPDEGYSVERGYINFHITSVSTDENHPTEGTLSIEYEALPELSLGINQIKGGGTTTISYTNWLDNAEHDGLAKQTVVMGTVSGEETEKTFTVYQSDQITLAAAPAENHRFLGWYEDGVLRRPYSTYTFNGTAKTVEARYQKHFSLYYAGQAETTKGGKVYVSGSPITAENPGTMDYAPDSTAKAYVESASATVYFKAIPEEGHTFIGWKKSPAGAYVSYEDIYSETFDATSKEETSPTTLTMYAYFEKSSAFEAELLDADGNSRTGSWNEMYNAAQNGNSVVLHKNIDLSSSPLNIQKNITLDFNNHLFTGTVTNLVTIPSGYTVTFADNSEEAAGGICLAANAASEICAVQVNGTLNFVKGVIHCENTSTEEGAAATGMTVSATMNLTGGSIEAQSRSNACGVKNNGTATLTTGTVNATAASDACGVLANGTTNITWSVAVNATATGANATGVKVISGTPVLDGGVITATAASNAYGVQVQNGTVTIGGNIAVSGTTNAVKQDGDAVVEIQTGRFKSNAQEMAGTDNNHLKLHGGYYVHDVALDTYKASSDVAKGELQSGTKFYTEGYRYILSEGDNPNYVVATANGKKFSSLEDAITYANNNPSTTMTIRLEVPEYTLPAGNYTIPAKATLLLPKDIEQTSPLTEVAMLTTSSGTYTDPALFQKLTLESGVHIDVYGAIEVGGRQHVYGQPVTGCPVGPYYSRIEMVSGSTITLADGGKVYAWGFVTGEGTIDARRGSEVWEQFQIGDFKGGTFTVLMIFNGDTRAFPFMTYNIQNVEVRTKYHPGASLFTQAGFVGMHFKDVKIIGVTNDAAAMFVMDNEDDSEDTWVCKYYDVEHDQQVYEINNAAKLGNLKLSYNFYNFNSSDYLLPITNNMKIHLLSGQMEITQNTLMLPGAQIEVNKKSTITVDEGARLFFIDSDEWGKYIYNNVYGTRIKFRPDGVPTNANRDIRSAAAIGDAQLNIHGNLVVEGSLYTSASGASIYSTNADAGTITIASTVPTDAITVYFTPNPNNTYTEVPTIPALLKNETGTPTSTSGIAAGTSYCYINGQWRNLEVDGCFVIDKHNSANTADWEVFAKPREYVKLKDLTITDADGYYEYIGKKDGEGHDTHTYDYMAEWNKKDTFLICMDDCQWWKVVPVEESDTIFHCTHPDNDKYYYWGTEPRTGDEMWLEKKCTVTWNNYDGTKLAEYKVDYKATPKYLGTNPTRAMNDYYTYDFIGWTPEVESVTRDITYTAQFQETPRKYMITFLDEDGSVLEEALWEVGKLPVCVNQPTPAGKILNWSPTIHAVTGDETYRATYTNEVLPAYTITFVNWDGTELQSGLQETGSLPIYDETVNGTPSKPSIQDKAFVFAGWTPDLATVSTDAIYTARFTEAAARYTITFKRQVKDDGSGDAIAEAVLIGTQDLGYGETPVCTTPPVKNPTAAEYYEVVWTPQIASVTGNATYTATGFTAHKNTCRLTVSAGANGKVALDGSEAELSKVYEYGTTATIDATATMEGYRFVRWSDGNTDNPRTVTVNATNSLKAEFALNYYTITWKDYDGSSLGSLPVAHGAMPAHAVPARANGVNNDNSDPDYGKYCSYTFNGWTPTVVKATGNAAYTATYTSSPIMLTIRFVLDNGLSDVVRDYNYGEVLTADAPTPVKASKNGVDYRFTGWRNSAGTIYVNADLPAVTNNEIYTAQYETTVNNLIAGNSDAAGAKDLILSDAGMEASALIIEKDGTVTIPSGASVEVQNFILESDGTKSGQLLGTSSARLTVAAHAYFDLTLNTQPRTWYAVAVPWEVDAENGIFIKNGRKLVLGRDFDLVWYKGETRATEGAGAQCWQYVEYDADKTMHPGRAYMMYFAPQIATVRFESKDLTIFDDEVQSVEPHAETTGNDGKDANWNGIANPKVFHSKLAAGGATYGYYLNNGKLDEYLKGEGAPTYKLVNLASYTAIVGKPLFIQAANDNPIVATATVSAAAPRRAPQSDSTIETVCEVTLRAAGSSYEDNIFIQTAEQKEPHYVIGQDLVKAGVNAALPQIWVNRYDTRLAVNTTEAVNGTYDYPLTLNIPKAGEYTICRHASHQQSEALYLTRNGAVIRNLSDGNYTTTFEKGTTNEYGLRIIDANAPQVTTNINEVPSDQVTSTKVLHDGVIYIIRGGNVYTIDGQLVK